jgi:hypothetical protein
MAGPAQPLIEALATIPEVRDRHGRRHPLVAMLAMACAAMLCGYRSYSAIAEWGRHYDRALVEALGFTHTPTPCAATFFLLFCKLDRTRFEAVLGAWAETVLAATTPADDADAIALDGKTLRGSRKLGAPGAHLLSAVSHRLGLTTGQVAVDDKTNAIGAVATLLRGLLLEGRVLTMDALLTQREVAHTIVERGGDYVMIVKGNHPQLRADLAAEFASPPPAASHRGRPRRPTTGATAAMRSGA